MNINIIKALVFISFIILRMDVMAATYQLGDLAPRGAPNGSLDISDVLMLQRMILGELTPTADEQIIGDVAPLGNTDGALNVADVLILQRAIMGQITLGIVNIAPPSPVLDAVVSPTNNNPYIITGTAQPDTAVSVYVNDIEKGNAVADAITGVFSVTVALQEGNNTIYATANDGVDVSPQSSPVVVEFQYIDGGVISGDLGGQTLNANTKYTVINDITVSAGQTVTIEYGSKIIFSQNTGLIANGFDGVNGSNIQINGTSELPVIFTSVNATPAAGDWKGIEIGQYASSNINHAVIEYAVNGIFYNRTNVNTTFDFGGMVSNSVIRNNINGVNVYLYATPQILANQIYDNENGLYVHHGTSTFRWGKAYPVANNNEIYSNNVWNYLTEDMRDQGVSPNLMVLDATGNWWGTADPALIAATIYDTNDPDGNGVTSDRPIVDFSDFLDAPGGTSQGKVMPAFISSNTTYNNGVVYVLNDVMVSAGAMLMFDSGVEVRVSAGYTITAVGTSNLNMASIQVNGTSAAPVLFTSSAASPQAGDWKGIEIGQYTSSNINHALIEYAENGIFYNNTNANTTNDFGGTVSNSVIRNNNNGINVYRYSTPQILANQIYNNQNGLYVHHDNAIGYSTGKAYPVVNNNEIYSNTAWNYLTEDMRDLSIEPDLMLLDATGNWWGTADPELIAASIYDTNDPDGNGVTSFRPIVDFSGLVGMPGGVSQGQVLPAFISSDTTYNSGIVYVVNNVEVKAGVTLTFNSGVEVRVSAGYAITAVGASDINMASIQVNGTSADPVLFTSSAATPMAGDWKGIEIGRYVSSNIDYAVIEYAENGIFYNTTNAGVTYDFGGTVSNSVIRYNTNGINVYRYATPQILSNQIYNNQNGLYVHHDYGIGGGAGRAYPVANNNEIYSNTAWNYLTEDMRDPGVEPDLMLLDATGNWWGTADPVAIANKIYDAFDPDGYGLTGFRPVVNFGRALDSSSGSMMNVYVNESINSNLVLSGKIYVVGDLNVAPGYSLSISSGAEVMFFENASLTVDGDIVVSGSAGNPVLFIPVEATSNRNHWNGIKINSTSSIASIDGCYISNASRAFEFDIASGSVSNCVITNNDIGVYIFDNNPGLESTINLTGNLFVDNNYGIYMFGGGGMNVTVLQNDIYDNDLYNVYLQSVLDVSGISFSQNWWNTTELVDIQATFNTNQISLTNIAIARNLEIGFSSLSIDNYYISPQNSTGINDTVAVTTNFAGVSSWTMEVLNDGGSVIYSQTGNGSSLTATWNGEDNGGTPQADDVYQVRIKSGGQIVYVTRLTIDNTLPISDMDDALNAQTYNVVQLVLRGTTNDINLKDYTIEVANTYTPGVSDYQQIYIGTQGFTTHNLYTWVVNDTTNNIVEPSGEKTLRLTVNDKAGNSSIDTVTLYLSHISISGVSFSPAVIVPTAGGELSVNFNLGLPAEVTLQIYKEGTTELVASRQASYTTAGIKTMIWDGKDDSNNHLPDEAYRFEILADSGSTSSLYAIRGGEGVNSPPGYINFQDFDPHKNIYLKSNVSITSSMRFITNAIQNSGTYINGGVGIVSKALLPGDYTILWDGRDIDGKMVDGLLTLGNGMRTLEQNAVFVQGNSPQLSGIFPAPNIEIKSDPYTLFHSYDQASVVAFTVDQDVIATVRLIKPCLHSDLTCSADFDAPGAITLLDNVQLIGGQANIHSFEWRGYDTSQATPDTNDILVSDEGTYTYIIKAVSEASGVTSFYRGSLGLYQ